MCTKWNREHQALWDIFKSTIRAFKISGWLTLQEENEVIDWIQKKIEQKGE